MEKETGAKLMKDPNRGSLFDQPMVVMVNGQSASASEIFASTLQDYNRAVIVGSKTYGKATGQITIPLGMKLENLTEASFLKSTEGIKVTTMKIFRLNGKCNQKTGVQPDVVLPDLFEKIDYNEATSPYSLPNELTSKIPVIKTLPKLPLATLLASSEARQKENSDFKKTKDLIEKTPRALLKIEGGMPMTLANVRSLNTEYTTWLDAVKQIKKQVVKYYEVIPAKIDGKLAGMDDIYKNTQLETMKEIESDFYLQESFKVISDLLNIKK